MLKQRLSPLIIVVLIVIALVLIAGAFWFFSHRKGADAPAPPITNDPYAGQISGPPTTNPSPVPSVAP